MPKEPVQGVWYRLADVPIPETPEGRWPVILLATRWGILGRYSGYNAKDDVWFIDDDLHDGNEPEFWILLPPIPRGA